MVPPVIGPECPSDGEREVFRRLRDDPGTKDWIVLHSLGLARHTKQVAGEVDFVAIIPGTGVLVIEVKGCGTAALRRENGMWFYGPHDRGDTRGPFRQASDGMHSLRRELLSREPALARVQFSSGVIFPFARFEEQSTEWQAWEVLDTVALRSRPIHNLLLDLMAKARTHLLGSGRAPKIDEGRPTVTECGAILAALRPNFDVPPDPPARRSELASELRKYTEEQCLALDAMSENRRTLFVGPAGTGKTLLAIEAARRGQAEGRRVLFVCYNRLLGLWLGKQTAGLQPEVTCRTLHQHMLAVSGATEGLATADHSFWSERLPELAAEALLADDSTRQRWVFDELVVDEAQDLFRDAYLDVLDLSVRGGLAAGRWRMFGDFENQAIFGSSASQLGEFRERRSGNAPLYRLRQNCRNTPLIAEYAQLLSDLQPRYERILRRDDGVQPTLEFYRSWDEQAEKLAAVLAGLEKAGFSDSEIVILSPRADSAAARLTAKRWKTRLCPIGSQGVGYGTVQSFKGLESPVVIVTDIETIITPEARALFYVAATRPLQRLLILAHVRVRDEATKILSGRK
jgi:hypothetical protein